MDKLVIWTVGHSTHAIERFMELLQAQSIKAVADVRRFPASRRHPHFSFPTLSRTLHEQGIELRHFPDLGGRRAPRPDSPNTAWRNAGFRGYADYMMTVDFREAVEALLQLAVRVRTAVLCAEGLWWQCHRALIADALKAAGTRVHHILPSGKIEEHRYTSPARMTEGRLTYTAPDSFLPFQTLF